MRLWHKPFEGERHMKKLIPLLLLAGMVFGVGSASAQVGQRLKVVDLRWQTSTVNGAGVAAVLDSSVFRTVGTQTTYDTTLAFSTAEFELPSVSVNAVVDTMSWFNLQIGPTGTSSVTSGSFDSLLVQAQVSVDGATWVNVTPNRAFDATRTTGVANMAIIAGTGSNAAIAVPFFQSETLGKLASNFLTATDKTMWGWPLMRFIVNTSGGQGEFYGNIRYFSSKP
jgi:hypothetical protein